MSHLELTLAAGETSLSVRRFSIREALSTLFEIEITALSPNEDLNLEAIVGKAAAFRLHGHLADAHEGPRGWTGLCAHAELVQVESTGLSTYALRLVPVLWLLTQRRNCRIFQHQSTPAILALLLAEWGIAPVWKLDARAYPIHPYRVQYAETDFAFVSRLLEEAGITFFFDPEDGQGSRLVFAEQPHRAPTRARGPLPYVDHPSPAEHEYITRVRLAQEVRPGRHVLRGFDLRRRPELPLLGAAQGPSSPDDACEQYHYAPGAFLVESAALPAGDTPVADDQGATRAEPREGSARAERALEAERARRRTVTFQTNALDLAPGVVMAIDRHPRADLGVEQHLLVTAFSIDGAHDGAWIAEGAAAFVSSPYRPLGATPRPQIHGVQSATVVGPPGAEIHTDELGRVRVQFPWDREGEHDDHSSCWIRVSQAWAGTGFGMVAIPRVGQEVLVAFFEGNPDLPIIVGRVFNALAPVPYKLPESATQTGWKSAVSPGGEGFNEILFDDAKGRELVRIQAQRDLGKLVKQDEAEVTGRDQLIEVGRNRTASVGAVDAIVVGERHTVTVAEPSETGQTMTDQHIAHSTGGATMALSGGNMSVKAKGNIALAAGGTIGLSAQGDVSVDAAGDITIKAGGNLSIEAGGTITLKGADVVIMGGTVKIN
jgi:type VI secretion system secreted protein VgrG